MIPIPYQKSCRIVAEKNWGEICQFGFTSFEKGTMLATFKSELGKDELGILEKVDNKQCILPGKEWNLDGIVNHRTDF